jgi:S1-C subfamily serine protease
MAQGTTVLELSRQSTVKLVSQIGNSSGTGFFIDDQYLLTCFHVVAALSVQGPTVNWRLYPDLKAELPTGETIEGAVVTPPTQADPSPLTQDFAVVKLQRKPQPIISKLKFAAEQERLEVGSEIVFSGFPLATPGMVTHRGMVSGFDQARTLILIQASINKGNSGGAALNSEGRVVGIISMREGGISQGLSELRVYIDQTASQGSVRIMGVDALQATKAIVQTLDQYISTGIGYARSIKFAREYIDHNPAVLRN